MLAYGGHLIGSGYVQFRRIEGDDMFSKCNVSIAKRLVFAAIVCGMGVYAGTLGLGTWSLNIQKSQLNGLPWQNVVMTVQAVSGEVIVTQRITTTDGQTKTVETARTFDGQARADSKRPELNCVATDLDTYTKSVVWVDKNNQIVVSQKTILSQDGKMMTVTTSGMGHDGVKLTRIEVYDRQ